MKPSIFRLGITLGALLTMGGCAGMAPKYSRPAAPVPAAWPAGPAYRNLSSSTKAPSAASVPWMEFYANKRLKRVIGRALENNRDLKVAVLSIERTRALYQIQESSLYPSINAGASATWQRVPQSLGGKGGVSRQYVATIGLNAYELDFFGRIRSLNEQALQEFLATEQARRSVQISLVSDVTSVWLSLAADQERLRLANETLAVNRQSYDLTKKRFDAGVASELDLRQAQTTVEAARVDIARYTGIVALDRNALDLLSGAPVPEELLPQALNDITALKELSPGLPSEVLQRRPDILAAENHLIGANANIGAARAAFFPRISLTTDVGLGSNELTGLFKGGAGLWAFAPQVTVPIFNAGLNKANLKASEVGRDILVAQYEKAIQVAFREVSDALAQRATLEEQLTAQQALVDAATATRKLSEARYEKGVESYLAVLDAQRSLYAAQQGLIALRLSRIGNLVTLYKVLGGGA